MTRPDVAHRESLLDDLAVCLAGGCLPPSDPARTQELVDLAIEEGVGALLAREPVAAELSGPAAGRLVEYARTQRLLASIQERELLRVLTGLRGAGVDPLVIKGAHLSRVLYPSPELRPRADTDLLIDSSQRLCAAQALPALGYLPLTHTRGTVILGQFHFERSDDLGLVHALDVHWRVASPLVFDCDALSQQRLMASAVEIPGLAGARGPAPAQALLLACIHLVAHHRTDAMLLWLFDIRLLVHSLDAASVSAFHEAVAAGRVAAVCHSVLARVAARFADDVVADLAREVLARTPIRQELSARLLHARRPVDELWIDLLAAGSWRTRVTLIGEHVWPDADFIRARAGASRPLPLAYALRLLRGARKWLSPSGADRRTVG